MPDNLSNNTSDYVTSYNIVDYVVLELVDNNNYRSIEQTWMAVLLNSKREIGKIPKFDFHVPLISSLSLSLDIAALRLSSDF